MKFSFIEIGTSDFSSPSQENFTDYGLCVEPIKYYLDRLPEHEKIKKENCAISNFEGTINIYYCSDEIVKKYNLPFFIRGCNKIGDYHPTVVKELQNRNLPLEIVTVDQVPVKKFEYIIKKYDCTEIDFLKIDCEGHDHIVIESFAEFYNSADPKYKLPKKVNFESFVGILNSEEDTKKAKNILEGFGYKLTSETDSDLFYDLK